MSFTRLLLLATALVMTGCDRTPSPASDSHTTQLNARKSLPDSSAFAAQVGLGAYTSISMTSQSAQELDNRISAMLYNPNVMTLEAAQQAWRRAYDAYLQTLVYFKYPLNDPIDWRKSNIGFEQTLRYLDTWPVEGGYIDYVPGYPYSGIVNDLTLELNETNLLAQHGFDSSSASLGYHAIEFMLWSTDGKRSARDFLPKENTAPIINLIEAEAANSTATNTTSDLATELNAGDVQNHHRRRVYLQLVSDQLQKHIHRLQRRWEPSNGHYASLLQRSRPEKVLHASFLAAQRILSEEVLDRRLVQNSSEFSATTWADVEALVRGVRTLFFPASDDSNGLGSVLAEEDMELLNEWHEQFRLIDESIDVWQQTEGDEAKAKEGCRQRVIELLSILQRTAHELNILLPDTQ